MSASVPPNDGRRSEPLVALGCISLRPGSGRLGQEWSPANAGGIPAVPAAGRLEDVSLS